MHLFFDTVWKRKKNTMENLTKEPIHLKLYNWQTLCRSTEEGIRGTFLIDEVTCQECLRISSSGSVAAPKEPWSWVNYEAAISLTKPMLASPEINQYHEMVLNKAKQADAEIASLRQQLKEREEALKELLPIAERKFNGISIDDAASHREYIALKAIIERARKTLNKEF